MKIFSKIIYRICDFFILLFNKICFWKEENFSIEISSQNELQALTTIKERAKSKETDISDHLENIFYESIITNPKIILELGVRHGESTCVFEQVAKLCNAQLISIDVDDCSQIINLDSWIFLQKDDIEFAKEFIRFCKSRNLSPEVDVLFIDTSHTYDHTVEEINAWFPFLTEDAVVIFHDTNSKKLCFRKDGSLYSKRNRYPQRDVIAAIEDYFQHKFNETKEFYLYKKGWLIKHYPYSFGLTVLRRNKFLKQ